MHLMGITYKSIYPATERRKSINKLSFKSSERDNLKLRILATSVQPQQTYYDQSLKNQIKKVFTIKRIKTTKIIPPKQKKYVTIQSPLLTKQMNNESQNEPQIDFQDNYRYHSTLKQLYLNHSQKKTTLVFSVNLILNQLNFWHQQQIEQHCIRPWRAFQSYAQIIWVCNRQCSRNKILEFCNEHNLRVHGIYLLVSKKKTLTVSYQSIECNHNPNSIIAVQGICTSSIKEAAPQCFINGLPVLKSRQATVHIVNINIYDRHRFSNVLALLSRSAGPYDVNPMIQAYCKKAPYGEKRVKKNINKKKMVQKDILGLIQDLKKDYLAHFAQRYNLTGNERIKYAENENSLQFIIGDMLRRNQYTLLQYEQYIQKHQQWNQNKKNIFRDRYSVMDTVNSTVPIPLKEEKMQIFSPFKYTNLLYLWDI